MTHMSELPPLGGPEPIEPGLERFAALEKTLLRLTYVGAGGAVMFLMAVASFGTAGASRAARLEWSEREAEVTRTIAEADGAEAAGGESAAIESDARSKDGDRPG